MKPSAQNQKLRLDSSEQRGFVLGEMILAVAILMILTTFAVQMITRIEKSMDGRRQAEQQALFTRAAVEYFTLNQAAMRTAMADGTGAELLCILRANPLDGTGGTQVNDSNLKTCAVDASWLKFKGSLAPGFSELATRSSRWVAIFKRVYVGVDPTDDVEMLVVMAREGADFDSASTVSDLVTAAQMGGPGGGYVPGQDSPPCRASRAATTYEACGAGGSWKVDLSRFISPAQLTTFAAALPS